MAKSGPSAIDPQERKRLGLDASLDPRSEADLHEIEASHCGLIPASAVEGMALAQRTRDAHLAGAAADAAARHGASVLVAEQRPFAATAACLALGPHRTEAVRSSVLMVEVEDGKTAAETATDRADPTRRRGRRLHRAPNAKTPAGVAGEGLAARQMGPGERPTDVMRRLPAALALLLLSAPGAFAACREDVLAAYEKQQATPVRSACRPRWCRAGPISMTVDYIPPDRMHQRANKLTQRTPYILVGPRAWAGEDGTTWKELSVEQAAEVAEGVRDSLGRRRPSSSFDCLGRTMIDGKPYLGYSIDEAKGKQIPGQPVKDRRCASSSSTPIRGSPRTVVALPDRIEKPFFRADYTYPKDLKIEAPVEK